MLGIHSPSLLLLLLLSLKYSFFLHGVILIIFQGARNEIFAMQPAPIQVSYMGFPGTTGATYIDYLVTDEVRNLMLPDKWENDFLLTHYLLPDFLLFLLQFVSPLGYANIYSEKIVHLPHCYFVNDYKQVMFFELLMDNLGLNFVCVFLMYLYAWHWVSLSCMFCLFRKIKMC